MFSKKDDSQTIKLTAEARLLEKNYKIQPSDFIQVKVYTKNGEVIIDPEYEMANDIGTKSGNYSEVKYLVRLNGSVLLPMIGDIYVEGLTLHDLNLKLKSLYDEYFVDSYVITSYTNKRVIVLGATGGMILPLENTNITLAEVIAMAGGMKDNGNASMIKLIRKNEAFLVDFSTIEGYYASNQIVQPGDIIYIEPIKRFLKGNAYEISTLLGLITTAVTLAVLVISLNFGA